MQTSEDHAEQFPEKEFSQTISGETKHMFWLGFFELQVTETDSG